MNGAETNNRRMLIITGASRGIGHARRKRFERGWRILTCSREEAPPGVQARPELDIPHSDRLGRPGEPCPVHRGGERRARRRAVARARQQCRHVAEDAHEGASGLPEWRPRCLARSSGNQFFAPLRLVRGFATALHRGKGAVVDVTSTPATRSTPSPAPPIRSPRPPSRR